MTATTYEFCKIFAKTGDEPALREMLVELLGGRFQFRDMYLPGLVVSVLDNSDAAEGDPGDDFVRWPLMIELETDDPEVDRTIVEAASRIVTRLWDSGIPAVAACDFEEELPWRGGIGRLTDL